MPIPQGWKYANNVLTAPNGVDVVKGFCDEIVNAPSWNAGNVPLQAEYHADQVLLHNPSVGAGQVQVFRDGMLWYTDKNGVVQEPYLGLEIDAAYKQIAQLQAEIATLKAAQPTGDAAKLEAAITAVKAAVAGV